MSLAFWVKRKNAPKVEETREIGALSFRAEVASVDEEKRTVEVVWTTGARVLRGFYSQFYEELSLDPKHVRMGRLQSGGAPLLAAHRGWDLNAVIGVVESARLEKGRGTATVRFAKAEDDPAADAVFRKVKDKILRNISVGYRNYRLEKVEEEEGKIPVYRSTDWEPHELSVVPVNADAGASVRSEDTPTNPCVFIRSTQETIMAGKTETNDNEAGAERSDTKPPAPPAAATPAEDSQRAATEAVAAERSRVAEIQRWGKALERSAEFVSEHVSKGTSADEFRSLALAQREADTPPIVRDDGRIEPVAGGDARDKWLRGAEHWLFQRAAVGKVITDHARSQGETLKLDPGEFRGMTFVDLARQALARAGVRTAGWDKMKLVGEALRSGGGGAYQATSDFPVLLENVMHKTLLASYATTPDNWSLFCKVGSVSDFRAHNRYRMGTFGRLDKVAEHGEFKNKQIPGGEKESISAATSGNIIALSRQALINDDMGAFSQLATMFGRAARLSIEADVFDLLALNGGDGPNMADGNPLFDAAHNNLGNAVALSVAGLDADRVLMASQMDPEANEYLELRPEILLVAIGAGGEARVINDAEFDVDPVDSGNPSTNNFRKPNKVRGLFRTIVDTPRVAGTRRYLFASPMIAPTIEVAFLDGQQDPFLELDKGWRIDGVEWKVRLDYGVNAVDFRGAVSNPGA